MSAARLIRPLATPAVLPGPTQLSRLGEHYQRTLLPSLLYMTYDPTAARPSSSGGAEPRRWDPSSPYTALRPARPARGNRRAQPGSAPQHAADPARDVPRLERVVITSFCKDAISNKNALVPLVAQLRAITGARVLGSAADASVDTEHAGERGFVKIVRAKGGAASFKIRAGMPVGAQAVLPGPAALDLIEQVSAAWKMHASAELRRRLMLTSCAADDVRAAAPALVPRLCAAAVVAAASVARGALGRRVARLPARGHGAVAGHRGELGRIPGQAVGLPGERRPPCQWCQTLTLSQIDCITSARGPHATEQARQLLSGLGVPFVRRGDMR
jgi:large subunit ribosomal protein L5